MASNPRLLYFDSCVFISYIDAEAGRVDVVEAIFDAVLKSDGKTKIVTSTITVTEVAFGAHEKAQKILDTQAEEKIDKLWTDPTVIALIEFHEGIARRARELMREGLTLGWSLKPADAMHLASAHLLNVVEFHTYDHQRLAKYAPLIGCPIVEPYTEQPRLL